MLFRSSEVPAEDLKEVKIKPAGYFKGKRITLDATDIGTKTWMQKLLNNEGSFTMDDAVMDKNLYKVGDLISNGNSPLIEFNVSNSDIGKKIVISVKGYKDVNLKVISDGWGSVAVEEVK